MKPSIRIGVLTSRNRQHTLKYWEPTAAYLTEELPNYCFTILPLDFSQIGVAVADNAVEFLIASSGIYVEFETLYGVNRLATLKKRRFGRPYTLFGGVIFSQDRCLSSLSDLKGKRVIAVAENSLGGWRMAWREFVEANINPYRDFQALKFGQSQDAVVYAIQRGEADAGIVATNVLEQMELETKVDLKTLTIINQQTQYQESFPFVLSTRLYPEWPFAATQHTPSELSEQVAIALLKLPADHPAAIAANSMGWTIPLNYQPVHECFQVLRVQPYKDFGKITSSFELAVRGSNDGLWDWNLETNEVFFSARWKGMLGYAETELADEFATWQEQLHPEDRDRVLTTFQQLFISNQSSCELEYRLRHRQGHYCWVLCRAILLRDVWNKPYRMAGSHTDITKRKQAEEELRQSEQQLKQQTNYLQQALKELQQTQLQLIHSEKMSGLGQLVAGIAHEINNPVNFIYGNLTYLEDYCESLIQLIGAFQKVYPDSTPEIQSEIDRIELEFILVDAPKLLRSMRVGTDRIRDIVRSLRNFSRLDEAERKVVDIHEGIENTLLILQHRFKQCAEPTAIQIVKHYDQMPPIECYPGQLNQVFMNILSNAIDALEADRLQTSTPQAPTITIQTTAIADNWVLIEIADNGPGMEAGIVQRIFDPFFTTKPVGQGTGLGLSISYRIVVEQHRGKLECYSLPGEGTTFQIRIPSRYVE